MSEEQMVQVSMPGGYMDLQLLLSVDGFVCELQVNLDQILAIKNSPEGHGEYEDVRLANDSMMVAAMKGEPADFAGRLEAAKDVEVSDMYKLRPLHYAAMRGEVGV